MKVNEMNGENLCESLHKVYPSNLIGFDQLERTILKKLSIDSVQYLLDHLPICAM